MSARGGNKVELTRLRQRKLLHQENGSELVANVVSVASKAFRKHHVPVAFFGMGVANALLKSFVFGAFPQYLWLYALIQFPFLLTIIVRRFRAKKMTLYFAEYCWVMNVAGWIFLGVEAVEYLSIFDVDPYLSINTRINFSRAFFGVANGPLGMAVLANANALVFHDVERTSSFFIHFSPALVSWTMRWRQSDTPLFGLHAEEVNLVAGSMNGHASSSELWGLAIKAYWTWWLVYGVWLLAIGHALPSKGWGHSSFADSRPKIKSIFGVSNVRKQACVYLAVHGVLCTIAILTLTPLLYTYWYLHTAYLLVLLCSAIYRGASYYNYSFGKKMEKVLKQALESELAKARDDYTKSKE